MPYYLVENFRAGIDVRKHPLAAPAGTLRDAVNAHVSPGGEIEKRKAFVRTFWDQTVDPDHIRLDATFGLAVVDRTVYVFQDNATVRPTETTTWATGIPGVTTAFGDLTLARQVLTGSDYDNAVPGAMPLDRVLSWDVFNGKIYVVAQGGPNGAPEHFYDGARVTDVNAKGHHVRTFKEKIYALSDEGIHFCAVLDPTTWTPAVDPNPENGAGTIFLDGTGIGGGELRGLEIYYDRLAVFSRNAVQIWDMDVDPALNTLTQTIRSSGLVGGANPIQYGAGDVLYLSGTGIRSLQARDSSVSAAVSDIGSPIDELIQALIRSDIDSYATQARTLIEEHTGRLWFAFGGDIWVLSQYPGPRVAAWSRYTCETVSGAFSVAEMETALSIPVLRSTDNSIYLYGGADAETYDETEATVELPFLTFDRPPDQKVLHGIDIAASGAWNVDYRLSARVQDWHRVGTITETSYGVGRIGLLGTSPVLALRFRSASASRAALATVVVHYDLANAE